MKQILQRAKIINEPITRVASLEAGFRYAYWRRFNNYPFEHESLSDLAENGQLQDETLSILATASHLGIQFTPDRKFVNESVLSECVDALNTYLSPLNSNITELLAIESDKERYAIVRKKISEVTKSHEAWFRAGVGVFVITAQLGFDLVALSTEEARAILNRPDVRSTGLVLINSLEDLGWSPDKIKDFWIEKVAPYLYENNLRKWVFSSHMAVMSDLRFIASEADQSNSASSGEERILGATKALIESIPIIGKPLAILVFGEKKK